MLFPLPHHLHEDLERFPVPDPAELGPCCHHQHINGCPFSPGVSINADGWAAGRSWQGSGSHHPHDTSSLLPSFENHPRSSSQNKLRRGETLELESLC